MSPSPWFLLLLAACAAGGPSAVAAPAGSTLLRIVNARGTQNYKCMSGEWKLTGPDAELLDVDTQKVIGKHSAETNGPNQGKPRWQLDDGSSVTGAKKASSPSPDGAGNIDWLGIEVIDHQGSGVLQKAKYVRRVHTKAGKAPPGACSGDAVMNAQYEAVYEFYQ